MISSRAPMSLEKWTEEEWYSALRCEIDLAGREQPGEESELNAATADLVLDAGLPTGPLFDQAVWRFNDASRLAIRAASEYEDHLKAFPEDELTYRSHINDLYARSEINAADALYLQAMQAKGDARKELARKAAGHYTRAANLYTRYIFRYFTDPEDAKKSLPPKLMGSWKQADVDKPEELPDRDLAPSLAKLRQLHIAQNYQLSNSVDFKEIDTYVVRCYLRLRALSLAQ
ncbi:MAG: hypothetical protein QM754_15880 [Tepidisphaeraceae bacterium]